MAKIIKNGKTFVESANIKELPAKDITYNPSNGLTKLNVQDELDEVGSKVTKLEESVKNLSFTANGSTLTITDGTHTWNISAN